MPKFLIHSLRNTDGDFFGHVYEATTPQAALAHHLEAKPVFGPVAWSQYPDGGNYRTLRLDAMAKGRTIVDGKCFGLPTATPDAKPTPPAAKAPTQDPSQLRDAAALANRTPRPNVQPVPVTAAQTPAPRVFPAAAFRSPDLVVSTHQVNHRHGSAALV